MHSAKGNSASSSRGGFPESRISYSRNHGGESGKILTAATPVSTGIKQDRVQQLSHDLELVLADFRKGQIRKYKAYRRIVQLIDENGDLDETEKDVEVTAYITKVTNIRPGHDASHRTPTTSGSEINSGGFQSRKRPNVESQPAHQIGEILPRSSQHQCDGYRTPLDEAGYRRPAKRSRLEESDMPWYNQAALDSLHPSCKESRRLLKEYHDDIPGAKFAIELSPEAPDGFPDSQWERILQGKPVDLDAVLVSFNLPLGNKNKTVRTYFEWHTAWEMTEMATAFLFPHREKELQDYGKWISRQFIALVESAQYKVIAYDIAVRDVVRGGHHRLLTDTDKFNDIYQTTILNYDD